MTKFTLISALALSTFIGCFPLPAQADARSQTGNGLLADCTRGFQAPLTNTGEIFYCHGVINGVVGTISNWEATTRDRWVCWPEGVEQKQMVQIVIRYLYDHPQQLHFNQAWLVQHAFMEAFPCPAAR